MNTAATLGRGLLDSCGEIGPVQARLIAKLREYAECDFATSIAERSPLGPRAIRVRPVHGKSGAAAVACEDLARWLISQPWVEAAVARPPHAYVHVGIDALCSWVVDGSTRDPMKERAGGPRVIVRIADFAVAPPRPLDLFRERAVGRAIAALLTLRGYDVTLEPVLTPRIGGAVHPVLRWSGKIEVHWVEGNSAPPCGDLLHTSIGGVDVPHGPLRARYGGAVSADDLLENICERVENDPGYGLNNGATRVRSDQYAEAVLAFVMLRTERARHIQLNEAKLRSESNAFDSVLAAREMASGGYGPPGSSGAMPAAVAAGGERGLRDLAIELDLLYPVAFRAASGLEPALLARYIRSLADQAHAIHPYLSATDPLWLAAGNALDLALALIGINVPFDLRQATPATLSLQGSHLSKPRI